MLQTSSSVSAWQYTHFLIFAVASKSELAIAIAVSGDLSSRYRASLCDDFLP